MGKPEIETGRGGDGYPLQSLNKKQLQDGFFVPKKKIPERLFPEIVLGGHVQFSTKAVGSCAVLEGVLYVLALNPDSIVQA